MSKKFEMPLHEMMPEQLDERYNQISTRIKMLSSYQNESDYQSNSAGYHWNDKGFGYYQAPLREGIAGLTALGAWLASTAYLSYQFLEEGLPIPQPNSVADVIVNTTLVTTAVVVSALGGLVAGGTLGYAINEVSKIIDLDSIVNIFRLTNNEIKLGQLNEEYKRRNIQSPQDRTKELPTLNYFQEFTSFEASNQPSQKLKLPRMVNGSKKRSNDIWPNSEDETYNKSKLYAPCL